MAWDQNDTHPRTLWGNIVEKHVSPEAANSVDTMVSAVKELTSKTFQSAEELRTHFLDGDKPLFSQEQAQSIYKNVSPMKGGSTESVVNDAFTGIVNVISGKTVPGPPNPAIQAAIASVQQAIRIILPFVFILNSLEQSPLFGDLIGAALDVTASVLPVTASSIQAGTPAIVGLIPIPYAGTVGIALGWMFSFFFLWLAMVIGVSRKDFSSALEATAGMIPVVGPTLMKAVASTDRVGTKLVNRAEKIKLAINQAYGSLQNAVRDVSSSPALRKPIILPPVRTGGKRLTRRKKYKNKWRKTLHRSRRR